MGAVLSCALLCMLPGVRCNIATLQNQFAFHPPEPTYQLKDGRLHWRCGSPPPTTGTVEVHAQFVVSTHGNRVAMFHIRNRHERANMTLLWSHGNAMDAGECIELLQLLAERLCVNVVVYDYSGYGASDGRPSESATYSDIASVHSYLNSCGVLDESIVVCGQSVGSGPSLWLVERRENIKGLILMSGLLSGLRVLSSAPWCSVAGFCAPPVAFACCDIYPNYHRMRRVKCPVQILHGTDDEVIHASHSAELHRICPPLLRRPPYFVRGAGHNDIVEADPEAFIQTIAGFLDSLRGPQIG